MPTTGEHWSAWARILVQQRAPYFLTAELAHQLPPPVKIYPRSGPDRYDLALSFKDSYGTHFVNQAFNLVVLLDMDAFAELNNALRQTILNAQQRAGRGQIYDWEFAKGFLEDIPKAAIEPFHFKYEQEEKIALDYSLWSQLDPSQQRRWLARFVLDNRHPYPDHDFSEATIGAENPETIGLLANTFAQVSGPNCFATALAATFADSETGLTVADKWLWQDEFLEGLVEQGYEPAGPLHPHTFHPDSILVWHDSAGTAQHACYLIDDTYALNKNAQAWFVPRHIAKASDILDYWAEDGFDVTVYRR